MNNENNLLNITLGENNTIKSVDLVEIINEFRKLEGKSELKHNTFMRNVRKEVEALKSLGLEGVIIFKPSSYINSQNKEQPCFELNHEAVKYMADLTKNSDRKPMYEVYEYMGGNYSKVYCIDRFEATFFKKLSDTLSAMNIELETQVCVLDKYRLDGFLPQYNIVIEYDESQHFIEPQKSEDIKRQKEIERKFGYKFIRLNYKDTDAYNIGLVIKKFMNGVVA